jgi:hypothetical protein
VQWEPGFVDIALAGATVILAFLIAAMVRLAILDWLTERQSRRPWTAIGARADEAAGAPVVEEPEQSGCPYAPAPHDPAVWDILRAQRHAVPLSPTEAVPGAGSAAPGVGPLQSASQDAILPGTAFVAASANAGGLDDAVAALSNGGGDHDETRREAQKVFHSVAPATATIRRQFNPRLTTQVRLVANAGWPGPVLRVLAVPVKIVSDIVVTAQGKNEPPSSKASSHLPLNGRTSASSAARIAGHAAPARSRLHRDLAKSLDPAAAAEARRQIVALAEALARQAAREDDAAEHGEEAERSPPEAAAEQSPSRGAKDDTD